MLYDFLIIKSAPFVSTLATLFFVKSLNKNALELFLTSRVTLNKSLTVVSADGKAPEHTLVTSDIASRDILVEVFAVTLL